jgi:hypothetical protein
MLENMIRLYIIGISPCKRYDPDTKIPTAISGEEQSLCLNMTIKKDDCRKKLTRHVCETLIFLDNNIVELCDIALFWKGGGHNFQNLGHY